MNYNTFYSEVGKLLYAVAKADGHLQKSEYNTLKNVVVKNLVPPETHMDKHGTGAAFYAEIELDFLEENERDPTVAFESFIAFIEKHKTAITNELLNRIKTCAREMAKSYRGITSSESTVLTHLQKELNLIFPKGKPNK